MKYSFITLAILLCCICCLAGAGQGNAPAKLPSAFEQTLIDSEKGFIAAAKKGDVGFLKRTLTDDFSYVSFDGQLYSRREMIDEYGAGGFDIMPYEMQVVSAGRETAIVTYNVVLRVPAAEDQGPPPRYQHFSSIWVKQGDIWKMKFLQMTASHWGDW